MPGKSNDQYRILIVDDEPKNIQLLGSVLYKEGFDAAYTTDPGEALRLVNENEYDLILLDIMMPGMDGFEVCVRLRENPRTATVPIIFLTARTDTEAILKGFDLGAQDYITKPFQAKELLARVRTHLELKDKRETLERINRNLEKIVEERTQDLKREMDLREKTTRSAVRILNDILALTNPTAFSRTTRLQKYVHHILSKIDVKDSWQYDLAAMLSQIGCVAVPQDLLNKVYAGVSLQDHEKEIYNNHPIVARRLLSKIPRLQTIAYIVGGQLKSYSSFREMENYTQNPISFGAQILHVVVDLDTLILRGKNTGTAVQNMIANPKEYNPLITEALRGISIRKLTEEIREVKVAELNVFMRLDEDVVAKNGITIIPKGQDVTITMIELLRSFAKGIGVIEPFRVKVYR